MKNRIVLSLLILLGTTGIFAQNALLPKNADKNFNAGKELYDQGKYAASERYFERFLQSSEKQTEAGEIQEAEYFLAATAYQLQSDNAEEKLKYYLAKHPYSPFENQVNFMLGMTLFEQKKYAQALTYFKDTEEDKLNAYDSTDLMFCEAYSQMQTKNYSQATSLFKYLKIKDTRYNLSAKYYYAYSEYMQGNFDAALPDFLELEKLSAYNRIVPFYIIQIYYKKGQYDELGMRAEKLLKEDAQNPNNAEIYRILGEIAYNKGDYPKAISSLKKYEELSPQVLRNDMYLLGLSYYQTKDYANSALYLSKVTTKADEMTENAYLHIGNSYVKLNDKTNARMAYEAAIGTNFNKTVHEEALYNYALTTYETNSAFGESISAFERFLSEYPDSKYTDKVYDYLSTVYLTSQNFAAAYESIKKIKKPSNELIETKQYILNQLGAENFARKDYQSAIDNFTTSLLQSPNKKYQAETYFWRAETYYRMGNFGNAIQDINAFFNNPEHTSSPNLKPAYYLAGYAYFSDKNYSEAISWFNKYTLGTLVTDPTYADAMNRMGDCYFSVRDFTNAERSYNKAMSASPKTGDYPLFQAAYVQGLQKRYNKKVSDLEKLITDYPRSEYVDDALYEIGRAYMMLENSNKTLLVYQRLIDDFPNSSLAPKTALEIGMVYLNNGDMNQAITAFKNVIAKYPGSEESRTALESIETAYIEQNGVQSYIDYTKTLEGVIQTNAASREDSLTFVAAEKQYIQKKYDQAAISFKNYLKKFCEGGSNCALAHYYLAESYYHTNEKERALTEYQTLINTAGNKYMEDAVIRAAEITYDKKDYKASLEYFNKLQEVGRSAENKNVGRLGVLRCSYYLHDHQTTINIAKEILDDPQATDEVKSEARYNRAKAYIAQNNNDAATADLKKIAEDTRTKNGAESNYLLADVYFKANKLEDAEKTITAFAQKGTSYQYWLARSFIVLADIYTKRGDNFQAKQYLLSLEKNYTTNDDIQPMIKTRLEKIAALEQESIIN